MIKKSLFNQEPNFFHLNFDHEVPFFLKELEWIRISRVINQLTLEYTIECIACVMMETHCHLLIKAQNRNENFFAESLLKKIESNSEEPVFIEPIFQIAQFLNTYKYIYRNPVEAGIVKNCEDYPFSTLSGLLGKSVLRLIVWDNLGLIQNPIRILRWLNDQNQKYFFQPSSSPM
jgi:putative transposase